MDIFDITASGLTAQRLRMDTISSNLANVNSTHDENGNLAVYKRKNVVFAPVYENAVKRFGPPGMGGSMPGIGGAHTLPMRPSQNGISIGADGRATLNLSASHNTGMPGAGVQVLQISDNNGMDTQRIYAPNYPDADADGYIEVPQDIRMVYDPDHPDAIPEGEHQGYVLYPNVNVVTEMVDMISATRAYEANVTALQSAKSMMQSALEI